MKSNQYIFMLVALVISTCVQSQVRFKGHYPLTALTVQSLLNTDVYNQTRSGLTGRIVLEVTEDEFGTPVMQLNFANVSLALGSNMVSRFISGEQKIFFDNKRSIAVQSTGTLPPGVYSICWRFEDAFKNLGDNQCFTSTVIDKFPLDAISPLDNICNQRPEFLWTGRKTSVQGVSKFRLVCTELKTGQSRDDAIANNVPLINLVTTSGNRLPFPAGTKSLNDNSKYVWQVVEENNEGVQSKSEITEFTPKCDFIVKSKPPVESFAELKPFYTGRKYYFTSAIRFSFINPYAEGTLKYAIIDVATNTKLDNKLVVSVGKGLNKFELLTEKLDLSRGKEYKLEVSNVGALKHYIYFFLK